MSDSSFKVNADVSADAQQKLQKRLTSWLNRLLAYEGFREWKNASLRDTLLIGILPDAEIEALPDFAFSEEIEKQHELVSGYYELVSSLLAIRQCEFYFRRYPFRNRNVTREAHLRTCCELFFSRVYQFRERFSKQLKRVVRQTKYKGFRTDLVDQELKRRFEEHFAARNKIHHQAAYDDIQLKAVGMGELLSIGDASLEWLRMPASSYRKITKDWVLRVRSTADGLDLFVGVIAVLMLNRCTFLKGPDA